MWAQIQKLRCLKQMKIKLVRNRIIKKIQKIDQYINSSSEILFVLHFSDK